MALSYYSNCNLPQIQVELTPEVFDFNNNFNFYDTCIDSIFEQPQSFVLENYQNTLDLAPPELDPLFNIPNFIPDLYSGGYFPESNPMPLPDMLPPGNFQEVVPKMSQDILGNFQEVVPEMSHEILGNFQEVVPEMSQENLGPVVYDTGEKKQSVSAQSIAARQRRRKISEKTQELGKLIPGGQKMNTAEMLQAAYKYVKFLQAQVAILQKMGSIQGNEEAMESKELLILVTSPLIQEKLYSEEKCLVPKDFVKSLANEFHLQYNPPILKEINQFIQSISG